MAWIWIIIVGAIIGWLASLVMRTDAEQGLLWNIIVGIIGSILGKYIFADLLGIGSAATAGSLTFAGILWGVVGAIILILILKALKIFR